LTVGWATDNDFALADTAAAAPNRSPEKQRPTPGLGAAMAKRGRGRPRVKGLTEEEERIVETVRKGARTTQEIADSLKMSRNVVLYHVIKKRTGADRPGWGRPSLVQRGILAVDLVPPRQGRGGNVAEYAIRLGKKKPGPP